MTEEATNQEEIQQDQQDQDAPLKPEPEPLWKQQGFSSPDEALVAAIGGRAEEESRRKALEKKVASQKPQLPPAPVYDRNKAEDDPSYDAVYQQQIADWQGKVMEIATTPSQPQTSQDDIEAATEGVLAAAQVRGIDRHSLYGMMYSMSMDPQFAALASTPQGIKELGKLASQRLKPDTKATEPPKDPPKKDAQYTGSDDASHVGKDTKVEDDETKRQKERDKAREAGDMTKFVNLALQKGLNRPSK